MKQYRRNNAIIHIRGEVDREKIEEATVIFLKKIEKQRKKEKRENVDKHTTRNIVKE